MPRFDNDRRRVAYGLAVGAVVISLYLATAGKITPVGVSLVSVLVLGSLNSLGVSMDPRRNDGDRPPEQRTSRRSTPRKASSPVVGDQGTKPRGKVQPVAQDPPHGDTRILAVP